MSEHWKKYTADLAEAYAQAEPFVHSATTHPERRAGQRYRLWKEVYLLMDQRQTGMWAGEWNAMVGDCPCVLSEDDLRGGVLLADAPAAPQPSAPVVACKAPEWCGIHKNKPDGRDKKFFESDKFGIVVGDYIYCAQECADADDRVPPMEAKPAEAKLSQYGIDTLESIGRANSAALSRAQTAEQPKPAKADPLVCFHCRKPAAALLWRILADGVPGTVKRELLCNPCALKHEDTIGHNMAFETSGKPYTGPERIDKPRMAHIAGMHDDDLIGGAR